MISAPNGEVIQPQLPLRLPCYDFWLLRALRFDPTRRTRPQHLAPRLQRRAVCTKSMAVFTGIWWMPITKNSTFIRVSCNPESQLRLPFGIGSSFRDCDDHCGNLCSSRAAQNVWGHTDFGWPRLPPYYYGSLIKVLRYIAVPSGN